MLEFAVIEAPALTDTESNTRWLEALPARTFKTEQYGDVPITQKDLGDMVTNFKENVRGQEVAINFDHYMDNAKGRKAAGWYKDFDIRPSSADPNVPALYAKVDFTEDAAKEVRNKEWKYFSLEWEDAWMDNDGNEHANVIVGGALTNRPIAKNILPINFSEAMRKNMNDDEFKAADRRSRTKLALAKAGVEFSDSPAVVEAYEILANSLGDDNVAVKGESKEWEHSEPGTGSPPAPRTDEDGSDDKAIEGGWRRDTPPIEREAQASVGGWRDDTNNEKGGTKVMPKENEGAGVYEIPQKEAQELLRTLDLPVDAKPERVLESVQVAFGELSKMQKVNDLETQEKDFSEKYPELYEQHTKLMRDNREHDAKSFSEGVRVVRKTEGKGIVETKRGLSKTALDAIEDTHIKFAEGKAEVKDFENCIKVIMNGGILEFGEIGHNKDGEDEVPSYDANSATGIAAAKKAFAELMSRAMQEDPDLTPEKALAEIGQKHPDLFEASRAAIAG